MLILAITTTSGAACLGSEHGATDEHDHGGDEEGEQPPVAGRDQLRGDRIQHPPMLWRPGCDEMSRLGSTFSR
jgi:hypothetical protein